MNALKRMYCRAYQLGFRAAMPLLPYRSPELLPRLPAVVPLLQGKHIPSVLLVADATVRRLGLTAPLEKQLLRAGIACAVYEQATPNPTVADVERAKEEYLRHGAGAIIAIGGGSAMGCAKVAGARVACPRKSVSQMKGLLHIHTRTPLLIAVPTTAGSGSETTLAAVITDSENHHKYLINDFALIPDYAVLDPEMTVGLPPFVTATTGLDALTHAVEAYIGRSTTAYTRVMCEEAVRLIRENLECAVENGDNREARRSMLRASYCAGTAFTRSYVGYVHGVAHSLGGQYGIAHGRANAVLLPVFLRLYGGSCRAKLARLARRSGLCAASMPDAEAAERFIAWIEGMNRAFGLPVGFAEIREEDIPHMAANAGAESNPLYPAPRLMDAKQLEEVYRRVMLTEAFHDD